jgi:probable rRNA maturation factor
MEPPSSSPRISFFNETTRRLPVGAMRSAVVRAFAEHGRDGDVEILVVDDERIRHLNQQHRAVDESTDVLTFPAPAFPNAPLGEIVICLPYAERQAALRGVSLRTELSYLAMHGALHLCGFEDEDEPSRQRMMREMARIGELVGLPRDEGWTSIAKAVAA